MVTSIVRAVGILLFAVAFFLPAVRDAHTVTGSGSAPMTGWMCATVAGSASAGILHLFGPGAQGKETAGVICLILSGWVNPLVLLYLLSCISQKFVRIRRVLAVAILICFAATWFFLFKVPMTPLIGHFLWVAGALMILAGEVVRSVPPQRAKEL
jgi:uncharacterized membrane protein